MSLILIGSTTYFLIAILTIAIVLIIFDHVKLKRKRNDCGKEVDSEEQILPEAPGPKPWPILGSLHILGQYDVPYKAFAELVKIYKSPVLKMKMGSVNCIVVNGLENIKEVLFNKGAHFDSRPNFTRYHLLFSGNKENSLAFSDWSELQKSRREMLRAHTFPRAFTTKHNQLSSIICNELETLLDQLSQKSSAPIEAKPLILHTCGNIFMTYFCSKNFQPNHHGFSEMVRNFDKVFFEVNQGYAADFMPFLMPLHHKNMLRMANWSHRIREFVEECVIEDRFSSWTTAIPEEDYVDCLINHVKSKAEPNMSWNTGLFALEDIIGGHSAIGNFLMKVFGFLATRLHVQLEAQQQIDGMEILEKTVGLEYRRSLPYIEAIIMETIRIIASPIVPHVASQNSSIAGYRVEKDTFIFLNNYDLNMSEDLWTKPNEFIPNRFVRNGTLQKPEHFLPFGGGRRSCMGYKMVLYLSFSTIASVLKNFTILPIENEDYKVPIGNLALPEKSWNFRFVRR
ncbi:cytochrome P450 307a1-like [Leptopilina heterotoma]|uniref:cytochrome P450 307a1-like n=1 Tax=Leptopilina heterotoma TaxID=63436 RepID=UPI001CAA32F6|nr:cytochrome P450 307a1-like [Leptopilina heterotoma]